MAVNHRLSEKGRQLADIRLLIVMAMHGDEAMDQRLALIIAQKQSVKEQIDELNSTFKTLAFKRWYL